MLADIYLHMHTFHITRYIHGHIEWHADWYMYLHVVSNTKPWAKHANILVFTYLKLCMPDLYITFTYSVSDVGLSENPWVAWFSSGGAFKTSPSWKILNFVDHPRALWTEGQRQGVFKEVFDLVWWEALKSDSWPYSSSNWIWKGKLIDFQTGKNYFY